MYLSEGEFSQYRYLSELQADANIATELLSNAFIVTDPNAIEPLRERFEAALGRVQRNLDSLEGTQFHADIAPLFARVSELGIGEEGEFNVVERQLRLQVNETGTPVEQPRYRPPTGRRRGRPGNDSGGQRRRRH